MRLPPGTRIGAYEVIAKLGEGGMGEVYRARDSKLKREVALKVLPAEVANDRDRLARFQREAEVLASLNHPHIAQIFGLEDVRSGGSSDPPTQALVMELVEGEDLAQRIARGLASPKPFGERGPIPIDEALPIAKQIAEALEAAHEQGIIHRDLKPANIKVRADGAVKVLDFGLAKAMEPAIGDRRSTSDNRHPTPDVTPTITSPAMTAAGIILGTAAYMSPEQARGKVVDKRTDVWSFGCVLYEMHTGRRAFAGDDITDTLTAIMRDTPDWNALPVATPRIVRRLLTRCLEKNPHDRLRDIGDARIDLCADAIGADETPAASRQGRASASWPALAGVAALALAIGAGAAIVAMRSGTTSVAAALPLVSRVDITPPPGSAVVLSGNSRDLAISRDGRRIAYVGGNGGSLFVRDLDKTEPVRLVDVGFPSYPFFSYDGTWLGYTDGGTGLMRVPVGGGKAERIASTQGPGIRATPGPDNTIVFALNGSLVRMPIMGGEPTVIAKPDFSKKEGLFSNPEFLPTGRAVLFSMGSGSTGLSGRLAVLDLISAQHKVLLDEAVGPVYAPSGHLIYRSGRSMRVVGFDLDRLEVVGSPRPLPDPILISEFGNYAQFDVASNGTLVFVPSGAPVAARHVVWVGRDGREQPTTLPARSYAYAAMSPDGTHVAFDIRDQENDIWIWEVGRDTLRRFTFGAGFEQNPRWTQDGRSVLYSVGGSITVQRMDGTGKAETAFASRRGLVAANSVTPDGTRLVVRGSGSETGSDLILVNLGDRSDQELVATRSTELNADISPDGRWMAYESDESGTFEIYVRPFPDANSGRWQISNDGGRKPAWNRNGRELFYISEADAMMAVPIEKGAAFSTGAPVQLFRGDYYFGSGSSLGRTYDVTPDGQRFLMIKEDRTRPTSLSVVLNWTEELKRHAPRP